MKKLLRAEFDQLNGLDGTTDRWTDRDGTECHVDRGVCLRIVRGEAEVEVPWHRVRSLRWSVEDQAPATSTEVVREHRGGWMPEGPKAEEAGTPKGEGKRKRKGSCPDR